MGGPSPRLVDGDIVRRRREKAREHLSTPQTVFGARGEVFVLLCAREFRPDLWLPEVGVPGSAPTEAGGAARAPPHHGDGGRPAALLPLRLLLLREFVRGALRAARAFPGRAAAARGLRPREWPPSAPQRKAREGWRRRDPCPRGRWLCPRAHI